MLSHPPHLSILRPSPCTTQFTVSTASPLETFSSRLWNYFTFLLRALLLCSTLLVLLCKTFPPPAPVFDPNSAQSWRATTINPPFLTERVASIPWTFLAPVLLLGFFLVFRRGYAGNFFFLFSFLAASFRGEKPPPQKSLSFYHSHLFDLFFNSAHTWSLLWYSIAEESLLTLRSLGIQTRSLSPYYFFPAATRFIPTSQIVDIFIHEAFRGFEVRYYLAVVVEGEGAVVVVFPVSRFMCLQSHSFIFGGIFLNIRCLKILDALDPFQFMYSARFNHSFPPMIFRLDTQIRPILLLQPSSFLFSFFSTSKKRPKEIHQTHISQLTAPFPPPGLSCLLPLPLPLKVLFPSSISAINQSPTQPPIRLPR